MDVSNGRIDNRRLGRAADLRKVGEESGKIKEPAIESLTSLAFNSIMGGTPLSGVGPSRGLALGLEIIRTQRSGKWISGRRGRLVGGRESQSVNGIGRRNGRPRGIRRISRGRRRGGRNGKSHGHGNSAKEEGVE
jgi:hypothetical protein